MANPTSGNWDDPGVLDSVLFASDALSNLSSAIFGQTTPDDMERAEIDDLVTGVVRNPGVHTSSLDCEPVIDNICLASDTTAVLDGDLDFQASTATNSGLINYWLIHDIALQMPANTIFRSLEEVRESQRQVMMLPQDNTIPQFANHEATLVSILVQAMESTDEAEDSLKVIKKFKKDQYTEATIEAVCWEILGAMIYRHKGGGPLTAEGKGKPVGTFRERFDNMHRVLKRSKSICKHALDSTYINKLADDPVGALKRVESNKKVNARKSTQISAGRRVLAKSAQHGGSVVLSTTTGRTTKKGAQQ